MYISCLEIPCLKIDLLFENNAIIIHGHKRYHMGKILLCFYSKLYW